MIPLALLPDTVTYRAAGPDQGEGPTVGPPLLWRCRIEPKTKLLTYADGNTANATDLIIGYPTGSDLDGAQHTVTPAVEDTLVGGFWAYGRRKVMSVETFRLPDGRVHHHEVWAGLG